MIRAGTALVALAVAGASACGDGDGNGGGGAQEGDTETFGLADLSDDADVIDVELDLRDDFDLVAGVAELDGALVVVTRDGAVVRCEGDDCAQEDEVNGLGDGVLAVADSDNALFAFAGDELVRSEDGVEWDEVDTSGLDLDPVNTIARDGDGLLAIGGDSEGFVLFRSPDGQEWEDQETEGLADEDTYQGQFVSSVAARADELVAAQAAEFQDSFDDSVFGIWTSDDGGERWREVGTSNDVEGLEDLDQPNTDAVPIVLAVDDGFLAIAGAGDDGDATLFRSEDGAEWGDEIDLGGPELPHPGDVDAATVTEDGVVAAVLLDDELTIWRVDAT